MSQTSSYRFGRILAHMLAVLFAILWAKESLAWCSYDQGYEEWAECRREERRIEAIEEDIEDIEDRIDDIESDIAEDEEEDE